MRKSLRRKDRDEKTINILVQEGLKEYYDDEVEPAVMGVYHARGQPDTDYGRKPETTREGDKGFKPTPRQEEENPILQEFEAYSTTMELLKVPGNHVDVMSFSNVNRKVDTNCLNNLLYGMTAPRSTALPEESYGGDVTADYSRTKQELV